MKRLVLALAVWLVPAAAHATVGLVFRTTCTSTTVSAPVTRQTLCWDITAGLLKYWDGATFVAITGTAGPAPADATYTTLSLNAALTQERVLTAGTAITFADTGANGTLTVTNAGVTSLAGTAAQITASAATGAVTLSIPTPFTFPGTVTNNLSIFGATTSAQLAGVINDETGTGLLVFATNPVLTTPDLGTPSALTLTNATGLPIAGITGLGAGVGTWLATPSSANLAAAVTGETGTGALVFATAPTLVTPVLGVATGTSLQLGAGTLTMVTASIGFDKITTSGGAAGAAGCREEYVCGTGAGTAKKIVYCGTSTTPVTIVDNVGGGVTGC